jgi:hypothetical protein
LLKKKRERFSLDRSKLLDMGTKTALEYIFLDARKHKTSEKRVYLETWEEKGPKDTRGSEWRAH